MKMIKTGKNDLMMQQLKARYRKVVYQFAPPLLPFAYLHTSDLAKLASGLSQVLHSSVVEYPDQLQGPLHQDKVQSIRWHLLRQLYGWQKNHPTDPAALFTSAQVPFLFRLSLEERWVLLAFFGGESPWSDAQIELVLDIDHARARSLYWTIITRARDYFVPTAEAPTCRYWPQSLAAQQAVHDCEQCRAGLTKHQELLAVLKRQIPRPSFTRELQEQIEILTMTNALPKFKTWWQHCSDKLYQWGVLRDSVN